MAEIEEHEPVSAAWKPSIQDPLLALALLLPAVLVAWPGALAPVANDPLATSSTAIGLAACAAVPAALLLLLRVWHGARLVLCPLAPLLLLCVLALVSALLTPGSDPFERTRALLWIATAALMAVGGAQLEREGQRTLVIGAALVAALLLGPALFEHALRYSGVLHNTGELSNAALVGAAAAAALFAQERGAWRHLGTAVLVLFLLHALLAPALTGLVALAAACALPAALRWRTGRDAAQRLLVVGALALAGLGWIVAGKPLPAVLAPQVSAQSAEAGGDLGGVEVRWRVARSTLALIADNALLGVGPGQFVAAFPPYRDPIEIERSSPGRGLGFETEVEHPHDDHLLILAELGLVGALAWLALLFVVVRAAWRCARSRETERLALALAAIGMLVAALANAPFSDNAAASTLSFAFFGALVGPIALSGRALPPRIARGLMGALALAFLLFATPPGVRLVQHGLALATFGGRDGARTVHLRRGLDAALAVRPDSVSALSLRARMLGHTGAERAEVEALWKRVLELRPHRFEALMQLGVLRARAGELEAARELMERATQLDPGHHGLLRNRVRLELEHGHLQPGLELLEELRRRGGAETLWLRDLGAELSCRGLDREARPLLALADPRFADLTPEQALEFSNHYRRNGEPLPGDGFRALADRAWARDHAEAGNWDDARRLFRQCLRITRDYVPGGAPRVHMELAAAMVRSGQVHEARDQLVGLELAASDWEALPAWALAALAEIGRSPPGGQ